MMCRCADPDGGIVFEKKIRRKGKKFSAFQFVSPPE
jgi:hypothetical protein